jgi:hypothetical protein
VASFQSVNEELVEFQNLGAERLHSSTVVHRPFNASASTCMH